MEFIADKCKVRHMKKMYPNITNKITLFPAQYNNAVFINKSASMLKSSKKKSKY